MDNNRKTLEEISNIMYDIDNLKRNHDFEQSYIAKCFLVERYGDWLVNQLDKHSSLSRELNFNIAKLSETLKEVGVDEKGRLATDTASELILNQAKQLDDLKRANLELVELVHNYHKENSELFNTLEFYADEETYDENLRRLGVFPEQGMMKYKRCLPIIKDKGSLARTALRALEKTW